MPGTFCALRSSTDVSAAADRRAVVCDVSVVISTHNRAHLLRPCLDALLRQVAAPSSYEIIVVDNNCTDGTARVIADFIGAGSRVPGPQ